MMISYKSFLRTLSTTLFALAALVSGWTQFWEIAPQSFFKALTVGLVCFTAALLAVDRARRDNRAEYERTRR